MGVTTLRNPGINGLNNIDLLLSGVNADLLQWPVTPTTFISDLCWVRPGGAPQGIKTLFPVRFPGNRWQKRATYEEVKASTPEFAIFSVTTALWAPDAEIIPALTSVSDLYGLVKDGSAALIAEGDIELERQLAELIANGVTETTEYDNLSFFNTAHECNPTRKGLKTFSNYKKNRTLNRQGILDTLGDLKSMPGPSGNLLSMPGEFVIFCSTAAQYDIARLYATAKLVPSTTGTASQENVWAGEFQAIHMQNLADYGSGKYWGIAKVANAQHRPFVFANPQPKQIAIEGVSLNEHTQTTFNVSKIKIQDVHGFGYLWPQLVVLCVEP